MPAHYSASGSGDGVKEFSAGAVDFGASDVPMTPAEPPAAYVPLPPAIQALAKATLKGVTGPSRNALLK